VTSYLAADLGRAGHALLTRFVPPVLVGMIFFPLYAPARWYTVPLFATSVGLAVVACFACRFLTNAAAYWLHDARGPVLVFVLLGGILSGLYFPLRMLPDWLALMLYLGTPFPAMLQVPLDVLVERDQPALQSGLVVLQAVWVGLLLALCAATQRRAERKLVVQGG
jgi:ABC-2 type transport system permease protein